MVIGNRLRILRTDKKLSQGDMEHRTGLLRCYISRVENGHTVPSVDTLEKLARALDMPLYRLLYDGETPPKPVRSRFKDVHDKLWGADGKDARSLTRLRTYLSRMNDRNRAILMSTAAQMVTQRGRRSKGRAEN
jgi:transcriptional regulator with XRE-family HTH domain